MGCMVGSIPAVAAVGRGNSWTGSECTSSASALFFTTDRKVSTPSTWSTYSLTRGPSGFTVESFEWSCNVGAGGDRSELRIPSTQSVPSTFPENTETKERLKAQMRLCPLVDADSYTFMQVCNDCQLHELHACTF